MKNILLSFFLFTLISTGFSQSRVSIDKTEDGGHQLLVGGQPFIVNGMNWDYIPIGTNTVNANFWKKPDDVIKAGLDAEMALLRNMGVNTIRQYTGVPAKWIQYIYEEHGIYTMLNHSFGRYGLIIDGVWTPITDYADPRTQEILLTEVRDLVTEYKDTPGLLFWLLGNENNYGLFWAGAETEAFPEGQEQIDYIGETRGRPMYRLMNEASKMMKSIDPSHPVAICNGDVLFIDIVAEECKDVDIYGANTYRGVTFTDLFDTVQDKLDKPFVLTEFGADAYNAIELQEDQYSQAFYMVENWRDIYSNAAGLGRAGNAIGGFTFQFSDGWWKFGFDDREGEYDHDNNASWPNGGYYRDFVEGKNNMNEEWFGICAKGPTNERGLYTLYPRAAYYALKEAHMLNPYTPEMTGSRVNNYFDDIQIMDAVLRARGDKAIATGGNSDGKVLELSNVQAKFTTFNTNGNLITTPDSPDPDEDTYPDQLGFDHMQSFFIGVKAQPSTKLKGEVNFNILGNVAANPIDQLFYENRGVPVAVNGPDGELSVRDNERIRLYNADVEWTTDIADIHYFNRTGHYHWGYEGDFFGLYPEANYGPNLDIYQGEISGIEIEGKGALKNFTAAFGPQLWWGANPAFLVKYDTHVKHLGEVTAIFHEDIDQQSNILTSNAIPAPKTRRAAVATEREFGKWTLQVGGLWGGEPLNDRRFQFVEGGPGNYVVYNDEINREDNWGGKAKLTYTGGTFNWYALGSTRGLVANGGFDQTMTFTGWQLKDNGSGNQNNFLTGFTYQAGDFQIAPNFLWQKPLVEAIPLDATEGGVAALRNILDDPFTVRANRETIAGELLLTYDPTPASYFYQWDNLRAEDAPFAANLGFVYRHLPTTMDSAIGFFSFSRDPLAIGTPAEAEDLWEVNSRIVSKINRDFGIAANLYTGNAQANGTTDSERLIYRTGGNLNLAYKNFYMQNMVKFNDWGPYDYHRDFNLTFPTQLMTDIAFNVGRPDWLINNNSQIGIRGTWRALDEFSPRFAPSAEDSGIVPVGFDNGQEWEIRTYLHINLGK